MLLVLDGVYRSGDPSCLLDAIPNLKLLQETPQDPSYHSEGSVWNHTKLVVQRLFEQPYFCSASEESKHVMTCAAILHDIAKATCTKEMDGHIRSIGHPRRGSIDARAILWRLRYPQAILERISRIVANHHVVYHAFDSDKPADWRARKLSHELIPAELITVCMADSLGRITRPVELRQESVDATLLFSEMFQELDCWEKPYIFPNSHTALMHFYKIVYPDQAFYQESGSKVIVMSGLPASGKDTVASTFGLPIMGFDTTRDRLGLKYGDNEGLVAQETIEDAKKFLREKESFVWNSTNINTQLRQKTLDMMLDYNAEVKIVSLDLDENTLRYRNSKRKTTVTNKALDDMILRWEPPLPTEAHEVIYMDRSL